MASRPRPSWTSRLCCPFADNGEWALAAGKPSPARVDHIFNRDGDAIASEAVAQDRQPFPATPFPADTGASAETNASAMPGMTATPLPLLASDRGFRPVGECRAGPGIAVAGSLGAGRPGAAGASAGDWSIMLTRHHLPATLSGGANSGSGDDFGSLG